MSKNTQLTNAVVNAQAEIIATALDDGYLRIYGDTQAATADTAIGAQPLLAELRFAAQSEVSIVDGLITFDALTPDASANDTGTATWFRALSSDGTTVVLDGSVGTADANMIMAALAIQEFALVAVSSFTHDVRNATTGF